MDAFDHERLDVYKLSLEFVVFQHEIAKKFVSGFGNLIDQIHRSSTSVVLNIAEGAGEFSKKEKARFYRMALRSATESAAILDIYHRLQAIEPEEYQRGRKLLLRVVAMLVAPVKAQLRTGTGSGSGTGSGTGITRTIPPKG